MPQLKFNYSLRVLAPSTTARYTRADIPKNTTDLSLDYSFLTDRLSNNMNRHPPLSTVAERTGKHLRWIAGHCPHLRTLKLIILTDECCAECSHAALDKEFGFVHYNHKREGEMSTSQMRLSRLPVKECFAVVVFKKEAEKGGDSQKGKRKESGEWWKKHFVKKADEEKAKRILGNPYGHDQMSLTQLEAQSELFGLLDKYNCPVLMAWHHWKDCDS